jgi:maltose alpha-D-glucosyltransferase / alpha-amylase
MERIIRLRKECPEFGWGDYKVLNTGDPSVLAIRYDWRNNTLVTLHNFHEKPCSISLDPGSGGGTLTNLMAGESSEAMSNAKHKIVLEGYGYHWYRVGGLSHVLKRERN